MLYCHAKATFQEQRELEKVFFRKQNKCPPSPPPPLPHLPCKSMKVGVVILVTDMSSHPILHFYQVPSKYSKGYSSYRVDTKSISNKTKRNNSKSKKARVVILLHDMSSCPLLHFYQVSSKYSKGYPSYRADKKFYADADADANGIRPKKICPPTLR